MRWFANSGIRQRVLWLALMPTLLISLIMAAYFVGARIQDLEKSLQDRGLTIAKHLAYASEYGVTAANLPVLQRLINSARDGDQDIVAAAIFDQHHRLFAASGPKRLIDTLQLDTDKQLQDSHWEDIDDALVVRAPIIIQPQKLSDIAASGLETRRQIGYVAVIMTRDYSVLRQYQTIVAAIIILVLGSLLGGFMAQRMARSVTSPVIQLAHAVNRIREGKLNLEVSTEATGELKVLENGINAMAKSLYEAREEMQQAIEQATADLSQTLETLEVQNVELDLARKKALEASRVKSEFLANMSHEIRTPMNGVIGFTNLLMRTELTEKQRDYLQTIKNSANGLLSIIDDILDFSKIEAGKMVLERAPLDVRELVDDVLKMLAPQALDKDLELVALVYNDVPGAIIGDQLRLRQIITNLVSNAIKFTEQGAVEVRVMLEDETSDETVLRVEVRDTGIGLNEQQRQSLFQEFNQADSSTTRRFGGTGLGLVISQKLVKQMGGDIQVDSVVGEGSTFSFTMRADIPEDTSSPLQEGLERLANRRVFVFDRHPTTRLALKHMLAQWQVEASEFESFNELDEAVNSTLETDKRLDAVLFGISPHHTGSDSELKSLLNRVKANLSAKSVLLLNSTDSKTQRHYLNLGADLCLTKPVGHRPLMDALDKLLPLADGQSDNSKAKARDLSSLRVLTVDDNEANLKLISVLLEEYGVQVSSASNGIEAVEASKRSKFDLILMDIQMPEMDGIEASRTIRANRTNKHTPIIALTAHAMVGEREALLAAGMDDYLTKPVSESQLKELLHKWTKVRTTNRPSRTSAQKVPAKHTVEAIDWEMSLRMAGGKPALAQDMLSMLVANIPTSRQQIQQALKQSKESELLKVVHKFHGATCYCGVPHLRDTANQLETQLKSQGVTEATTRLAKKLFDEMERVVTSAEKYRSGT